ncbi:tRNA glutamyl-Q(34) synthetase GluQRS [Ruegeria lacuscaerulensis]|uniref:tRNA glutamyl-Q(34) synthetase GluQRS n=1 Tax=Ruegeria lacuscaerulensis TaxID=55218 RepID=UPI00148117C5
MIFRTRFAPSPTGPLHLGHAYSAMFAHDLAVSENGQFLLRIEDIDRSRSRSHWEQQIYDDLNWLGLRWPVPVMRQSERLAVYDKALDTLWEQGLLYPCTCNRRDIAVAASAPQEGAPLHGPDGIIYPGTCRRRWEQICSDRYSRPKDIPLRLDIAAAARQAQGLFHPAVIPDAPNSSVARFQELGQGPDGETGIIQFTAEELESTIGDVVLSRRNMGTSYHLSVVLDDAAQKITHVVRGQDLFEATRIHVLLQALLGLPTPLYYHHQLVRDEAGKRLAKRDDARAIAKYRADGVTTADVRSMVGL